MVTSCKDNAPSTDITASSVDKAAEFLVLYEWSDEEKNAFRAGYEGDTAALEHLKNKKLIHPYCAGAAAAGHKELILQCLEKGADPRPGFGGAAAGGHLELVKLILNKGIYEYNDGLFMAAWGGHTDIMQLLLKKGADTN